MKRTFILAALISLSTAIFANPVVNDKVLKSFNKTFATAEEVRWHEANDHYTVSFKHSGIRTTVNYDKSGNMVSTIRYYLPELLPLNVLSKLTREYSNATLFGVTEIGAGNNVVYVVKIEEKKNWSTVKIDNSGNMEVIERYRKA